MLYGDTLPLVTRLKSASGAILGTLTATGTFQTDSYGNKYVDSITLANPCNDECPPTIYLSLSSYSNPTYITSSSNSGIFYLRQTMSSVVIAHSLVNGYFIDSPISPYSLSSVTASRSVSSPSSASSLSMAFTTLCAIEESSLVVLLIPTSQFQYSSPMSMTMSSGTISPSFSANDTYLSISFP